ncbi:Sorting nexin-25 [Microtus ochrogaster]|uniref:Sorting nexin-25 n=1 Tax=Microtus ochrogaster TaxID=79684 RepID=A0A8J6FXU8_MICOH|nr:Sorting nexin-25 [Microtus ochrogaster]
MAVRCLLRSPVCGYPQKTAQGRRVVIFHTIDRVLKDVFDYSYRDYILSWYGSLSRDEGQLYHLLLEDFWEIAKQIRHRPSHVDVLKVCSDVVKALLTCFCDLEAANARHEERLRPFVLHACLKDSCDKILHLVMDVDRDREPHWSTGLISQGPNEEWKKEEDEQGSQDNEGHTHPLRQWG